MFKDINITTVVVAVFLALLALSPVGYMAWRNLPPHIATVDLQKLVEEEQKRTVEVLSKGSTVSDEQRATVEKLTIDFAKKLSANIDQLGAECKCVIVNKAALLGGTAIDYTDLVRDRMKR